MNRRRIRDQTFSAGNVFLQKNIRLRTNCNRLPRILPLRRANERFERAVPVAGSRDAPALQHGGLSAWPHDAFPGMPFVFAQPPETRSGNLGDRKTLPAWPARGRFRTRLLDAATQSCIRATGGAGAEDRKSVV